MVTNYPRSVLEFKSVGKTVHPTQKTTKRSVKKKVIEPAKGVLERTIRKHPMLKQVI